MLTSSGTVPNEGGQMDRNTIEHAIKVLLIEIHGKLDEASRIAKAAEAWLRPVLSQRVCQLRWKSSN
jgi:hypothetical protein